MRPLRYWNGTRCVDFGVGQGASAAPISAAISAKRATPASAKSEATLRARALWAVWPRCTLGHSPLRGCASLAPCHTALLPLRAAHSSISTFSYEFSRLFSHRCFSVKFRRGSAHPEASDGGHDNDRFSERSVCPEGYRWHFSDDDLVLSHARIAAAIRPELSLSIPRFERHLHHTDGSSRPEGKAKHATDGRRVAYQCRDRARFDQLEFRLEKNSKQILHERMGLTHNGLARIERAKPDWSSVTLGDGLAEVCRRSPSSYDDSAADVTTGLAGYKVQASVHGEAASSTSVPARSANNGIGFYKVKIAVGA